MRLNFKAIGNTKAELILCLKDMIKEMESKHTPDNSYSGTFDPNNPHIEYDYSLTCDNSLYSDSGNAIDSSILKG